MARDIFSIPGMSAKVERLFSSTKLMLPPVRNQVLLDGMEAAECIRSWTKLKLVLGNYFEYLPKHQQAREHSRSQEIFMGHVGVQGISMPNEEIVLEIL